MCQEGDNDFFIRAEGLIPRRFTSPLCVVHGTTAVYGDSESLFPPAYWKYTVKQLYIRVQLLNDEICA